MSDNSTGKHPQAVAGDSLPVIRHNGTLGETPGETAGSGEILKTYIGPVETGLSLISRSPVGQSLSFPARDTSASSCHGGQSRRLRVTSEQRNERTKLGERVKKTEAKRYGERQGREDRGRVHNVCEKIK